MAFEEITVENVKTSTHTGAAVSLVRLRNNPARMRIMLRPQATDAMGWKLGDHLKPLLGTGDDHGVVRLQKNKAGQLVLRERMAGRGGEWLEISLGHRREFVDRSEKAVPVAWEKVDEATLEIILPAWADETRPRKGVAITATPPAQAAGKRELERQAREAAEADRRRVERDKIEESEAWTDLKRRLDHAPVSTFDQALRLTRSEKALLTIISDRAGKVVSKETLSMLLYADRVDNPPDEKIIDVWVCKIKPKIQPRGCDIETVWGEGVVFRGDVSDLLRVAA